MKFLLLAILVSCGSTKPGAPQMSRKIKVWNGAPEEAGICRGSTGKLADTLKVPEQYVGDMKKFHQGLKRGMECLDARDEAFKQYACLTFADLGVVYKLIETMYNKCQKW